MYSMKVTVDCVYVHMYILRASWKISYYICTYFVCAKCSYPQKIKALLTYLLINPFGRYWLLQESHKKVILIRTVV